MNTAEDMHGKECGRNPEVVCRVPGVCTLLGSFSEYCEGWALLGTTSVMTSIAISRRPDTTVRLFNASMNDRKRFSLNSVRYRKEDRWGSCIKGAINEVFGDGAILSGMDITCSGQLLTGGENDAVNRSLATATVLALDKLYGLKLSMQDVIRLSYQAITRFAGAPARMSEMVTMLQCPPGKVLLFDLENVHYQEISWPFGNVSSPYCSALVESRIAPQALQEEKESRREETKAAFQHLRLAASVSGPIRDFPLSDIEERAVPISDGERAICGYVLEQSREALSAADCLRQKDAPGFARIMVRNQNGLRDRMEMTCPETDWLVRRVSETQGCIGAMQIADGLAGSLLLLVDKEGMEAYKNHLVDYEHIFGFHPSWRIWQSKGSVSVD